MRRYFLPIGQGAFCVESFSLIGLNEPINVVFDCGVLPKNAKANQRLDKAIAKVFGTRERKTIHAVFLSHLHEDHDNGLDDLKRCCDVKQVFYPGIDEKDKTLMKFWYLANGQGRGISYALCMNNVFRISRLPHTNLVQIPADSLTSPSSDTNPDDETSFNDVTLGAIATFGLSEEGAARTRTAIAQSAFANWRFRPFNYRRKELIQGVEEELRDVLSPNELTDSNLDKLFRKSGGKQLVKDAYDTATGHHFNTNSMVVFSGPDAGSPQTTNQFFNCADCCHKNVCATRCVLVMRNPGCLYTGDYDASSDERWKALKAHYEANWNSIGCWQIPHHGSRENFNPQFLKKKDIFVVSAGANSSFGHPHACVKLAFQDQERALHCVTENPESCICTIVCG